MQSEILNARFITKVSAFRVFVQHKGDKIYFIIVV